MTYNMTTFHNTMYRQFAGKLLLTLVLMLASTVCAWGQTNYVFYNGTNGYIYNNGSNGGVTTTFTKSCIWVASADLGTTSRTIYSYTDNSKYMRGGDGSFSLGNSQSYWQTRNSVLTYRNTYSYHVYWTGSALSCARNQSNSGFTPSSITIRNSTPSNPTISISAAAELSSGGIQLTGNVTGTYTPSYSYASVHNYNNNNSTTYYWTSTTEATTTQPSSVSSWDDATRSWEVTAGSNASVNGNGLLTFTGDPGSNVTVRLTVSKGGYTGTQTITLTRASIGQSAQSTTTLTDPSVTPASAKLEYSKNQEFSVSAVTATTITTTIPAHITLTGGGNTYYYYNNTLYTSTDGFKQESTTNPSVSYSWALTNHDGKLTPTSGSGATITITHSTQATADVNATLTVTASAEGESKTATASVKAYAAIVEPSISLSGTTISIATTSSDATIYYTTDESTPSANNGTQYTGPFEMTSSPLTIKAIAIRNNNSSTVASETFSLKLPTPVITINPSTGSTSIAPGTDTPAETTIYYTTDGTDPSSSATRETYSSAFTVTSGKTVRAIAIKTGYANSEIAQQIYVKSGTSGGIVTLNDIEDHNWTYYAGVDASVDGGNYNTNYVGKMYSPNPRNVKITYKGVNNVANSTTDVQVSISESENQFDYYKTLEEGTTAGAYPYQVISNPFSVRPSTGSGNSKVYYGFAGWKITKGYQYIKRANGNMAAENAVLNLDEQISFVDLPYPSVNCISAEIEFETTWTTADVRTGSNISTMVGYFSGGTYETNFAVLTGAYTTAWTGNKNVTSVYPDGSSDVRSNTNYTRLNVTVNSGYTIKYEYININDNSSTLSMGSGTKTLYIGRGVSNTTANGVVCNLIQGYGDAITSGGLTYTLKIESGIYNYLSYIKGYDGAQTNDRVSGTVSVKGILGCDYDRAKGDNSKLKIQNQIMMGYANSGRVLLRNVTAGTEVLNVTLKSGSLHSSRSDAGTADAAQSFYIGIAGEYSAGYRVFTMEGGEMWSLAAGLCNNTATTNSVRFRIKGGLVKGSIYGSAANANSYGYKQMIITGGTIRGWIAGGGNGTSANGGTTTGSSYIYVGGNARIDSQGSNTKINSSLGGQVFGSGSGVENTTTWGEMLYGSNVVLADNAYVERNVFGGGNFGWTDEYATIYLTGESMSVGKVFGGANQNKGDNVKIYMTGGTVREGLYGGSNTTGTINYNVEMHINGGQVGTSSSPANIHGGGYGQPTIVTRNVDLTLGTLGQTTPGVTVYGDVYGGSALGRVNGTAGTDTYHTYVTLNKGTINGSLYGGALGDNDNAANVYGPVQVKVYGGSVKKTDSNGANGSGGVYGANNVNGAPQRSVTVDIYGTDPAPTDDEYALFAVYGGGNQANYTYGNGYPKVTVHNCDNSIEYVYGGGNAAAVAATDVTIYGGNVIGNVFGGGNGTVTAANVTGNTLTKIYGGTILKVFGGSNSQGSIGGTITVNAESQTESGTNPITGKAFVRCPIQVDELYGGGNMANSNVGSINIGCMEATDMINYVYGGANQADITGSINLLMTGGRVGNLFGGNNISGNISGSITVTVNWTTGNNACPNSYLGNVFGGGNLATFGTQQNPKAPTVNIYNGTVSGNVYGGGKGKADDHTKGQVTGNPQVIIGDNVDGHKATVSGSVFGGGDAGNVVGTPVVNVIEKCNTEITTAVYGGGNAADVSATDVRIYGGNIGDVFGGGNGAVAAANVTGATSLAIHGGTISRVFAGGNTSGTIGTNSGVTIDHSSSCDQSISEVYGGGNLAAGNAGTVTIECTAENIGDVYGGANQANVTNDITLNITGGQINNVFGGNNTSGSISGGITVNINKDTSCNTFSVNNVYGGGNLAQYTIPNNKALAVNILNGTVSQNVYGGGKGDPGDHTKGQVTGNPVVTIGDETRLNNNNIVAAVTGDVYGGGDAGNVVGTPQVNVINKCNTTIGNVYGGGNAADVTGTDVNIDGGNITGMVFGGGHGDKDANPQKQADVNGNVAVDITGGTIAKVFGGSNSKGNITGTVAVNIDKGDTSCEMHITEVYGGGNQAAGNAGTITIGCTGGATEGIGDVYGGAREANINSDITLNITGGKITNVFGGNNISGSISGGVEVNINWNGSCDQNSIQNVYGGGNLAQYTIPNNKALAVNILNGTVSQNVYGGGKGLASDHTKGQVTGNPVVTVGDNTSGHESYVAAVTGDVYGGGDAGNVVGTPVVNVVNKCNTTIGGDVYGGGNAADVSGTDVNIDGGTISGMVFGGGHGNKNATPDPVAANVGGNVSVDITGGTINKVFGGSNSMGNITGTVSVNIAKGDTSCEMHITEVYGGGNEAAGNAGTLTIGCTGDYTNNGEGIADVYGGANAANINNDISLTISGGHINRVFGGNNASGSISGTIAVNVNWNDVLTCDKYLGSVFGGGNLAGYTGSPTVTLTNGTVSHSVYGGGNEAGVGGSTVNINGGQVVEGIYGGCNTSGTVTGAIAVNINGGTLGTSSTSMTSGIFGGGYGASTATNGNVTVTIGDLAGTYTPTIYADIYGGSALGNVNNEATDITTVNFLNGTLHGNLFGGGLGDRASLGSGHSDVAAKVNGKVIVNISNTTQTAAQCKIDLRDATIYGCNNTNGSPQDEVNVNIYKTAYNYSDYTTGDNYTAADGTHPYYAIDQVFGGGNQADYAPENGLASSTKEAIVHIYGCNNTVRRVFGGGNAAAATGIQTIIEGGRYDYVFGGGNGESSPANIGAGGTDLQIHGGNIRTLFGGSNTSGTITGDMGVLIDAEGNCGDDMYIAEFFCGNNLADIGTQANPTNLVATIGCGTRFGDVYGGCNLADIYGSVTLTIEGGTMTNVYGGSKGRSATSDPSNSTPKAADINGDVTLNITGGSIGNAFGGSNINGNITGSIQVNVEKAADPCLWSLGNVYGASNQAAYTPTTPGSYPAVNIKNGAITGSVFGGGLGATATVTSNPVVTIGDNASGHESYVASIGGDVYGGGDAGNVVGTTHVNVVNKCNTTISGDVYGGGNAANVNGTDVNIDGGTIAGMVFGGGHGDKDANPQKEANVNGNVTVDVTGGTINKVFGGSNSKGNISGTVAVNIAKGDTSCDMHITEVYGGGNQAAGNAGTLTIGCTGDYATKSEGITNVYGGANAADIGNNISLTIQGGHIDNVYGGNNTSGSINGTITVNVNWNDALSCDKYLGNVFGGGNQAVYTAPNGSTDYPAVNILKGTVSGDVFGGGYGNAEDPTKGVVNGNPHVTINGANASVVGGVYGGGSLAPTAGNPVVTLTSGSTTKVFGGGKAAGITGAPTVNINGGTVSSGVYGGCDASGTVSGNITVNVTGGTVGADYSTDATKKANVFGGGFGEATGTTGNVEVNIGTISEGVTSGTAVIYGDVYGGSALGSVNGTSVDASKHTYVNLNKGTIYGDAYGGGLGRQASSGVSAVAANVYGNVKVTQNGVAFVKATTTDDQSNTVVTAGRIFGCNNLNGSPQGTVLVLVNKTSDSPTIGTYDMNAVYGGGNLAAYNPATATLSATGQFTQYTNADGDPVTRTLTNNPLQVVINGCTKVSIEYVYGGGNAAPTPSTDVLILGAYEIGYVFGGGNGKDKYTLDGGEHWNTNPGTDVGVKNNMEYGTGDANSALYGGTIHEAYGASNQKGTIKGDINLDVKEGEVDCPLTVGKIVGAGKNADVEGDIALVMGCMPADRKTEMVFGGADNANVNGNVELTITSGTFGQVFGGNNLGGIIKGHIKVNIEETGCNPIKIDELYLGGNQAAYSRYGYYNAGTAQSPNILPRTAEMHAITDTNDENYKAPIENPSNTDNKHPFPYAEPELNVISCTYIGKVFGGGLGTGAAMYANPTVNINMMPGLYANDDTKGVPFVMSPSQRNLNPADNPNNLGVLVDVYGGGNEAAVNGSTQVNIGTQIGQPITLTSTNTSTNVVGAFVSGTVYGAGKGLYTEPEAAIVTGNTQVNMAGGHVSRSIYGGGELSSVGTFTEKYTSALLHPYHAVGEPKTCQTGTGETRVTISGGQVGLVNQRMPDPTKPTSDDDYGYVFCAGKGVADSVTYNKAHLLAVCGSSHLIISGGLVAASAYGGSENGQVLGDTRVDISGGQIGSGYNKSAGTWDPAYGENAWNTAITKIKESTFTDADAAGFHECDAWDFGDEDHRFVYDYYAKYGVDKNSDGKNDEYYYDAEHNQPANGGSNTGGDGHSYYGHVFGGGSGYYPFAAGTWRRTAGRVNGNTTVTITGGHILTNVYGGNEITDVLGKSTVTMTSGTVGVPRTLDGIQARPVNSYIFGAGMGDPRTFFNGWSNVGSSEVKVGGNAVVFGSVFGGGEDGHVLGDSKTSIEGNAVIGTFGTSGVDGNIFGSGRGFSAIALTAGVICGNITVDIKENAKILGSVYGGGRLAAVGTYLVPATGTGSENYGKLQPGNTHGNVTINITGGTIGTLAGINSNHKYSVGDVFGGSKGTLMEDWAKSQKLGLVKSTTVNISQASGSTTTIYGNVYGGGEIASVGSYTYATTADDTPTEPIAVGDVIGLDENETSTKNGLATILITGGTIGQNTTTDTHGSVFGGCLGRAGKTYSGYSFVNNSDVTLNGGTVCGSIFGGGENGHVFQDTDVKIQKGTVGIALDKDNLADANLNANMIYRGNVYGGGRGIDTYKEGNHDVYSVTAGKVYGNTNVTVEGTNTESGGSVTTTTRIYRNVYGGGSLASVGDRDEAENTSLVTDNHPFPYKSGLATVTIKGGIIGTDGGASANDYTTLIPNRDNRRENGFVFGSGRGMAAGETNPELVDLAYTKNTLVNIEGSAIVTGSVFGGGENGHVRNNTKVYVKGGSVGTELIAAEHVIDGDGRGRLLYRGNVYGGGRGIDMNEDDVLSLTAGRVYGNTYLEVSGGKIYHDVFGGGSLASVGNETENPTTHEIIFGDNSGLAEVHINGGEIGYSSTEANRGFNCGFVYGGCRGLSAEPNSELIKMAYVHNTKVCIEEGAQVYGSVFGGGANGHVKSNTEVRISGGSVGTALTAAEATLDDHGVAAHSIFRGNVYAGGRGVDQYYVTDENDNEITYYSMTAGAVYGNATLTMTGGHVYHNIYGSGAMASVGTVEKITDLTTKHVHDQVVKNNGQLVEDYAYNPDETKINYLTGVFKSGTGKVTMTITGGIVGDDTSGQQGINNGNVFGAGRGVSASRSDYVASMVFVNETDVTIGSTTSNDPNTPYIYGNVYGGGENGHVKTDTNVKIYNGIIGWPLVPGDADQYKEAADGSVKNPYRGHVFGGGCGVDPLYHGSSETRSSTAGRVYGHTNVTMTGGVVRRAIYGGGLLASVGVYKLNYEDEMHIVDMIEDPGHDDGGDATITISGGYVGNVDTNGDALDETGNTYLAPGDNNGHVFGSSCGMVADVYEDTGGTEHNEDLQYRQMGYTHSTHVSISGNGTHIFGCVFGSGENGHVWEDAQINISGGEIGSSGNNSIYVGNVYGSGRGVDHPHAHISETAGKVRGNTAVNVTGGTIWRDVYGGGSLASVGVADETADNTYININDNTKPYNPFPYSTGLTRVTIDGTSVVKGSVYGSGRGVASTDPEFNQAAYVKNTLVTVKGTSHVFQNVFGGGNAGHVRNNTDVTVDGSAKVDGNVYGGGAGDISSPTAGLVNHDVAVNIKGGLIAHDVYGGGAIANSNTNRGNAKTEVNLLGGIILGDAYGGGQGVIPASTATAAEIANAAALVQGDVTVTLNGTAFVPSSNTVTATIDGVSQEFTVPTSGRVFGCNNLNGTPQGTVLVHVLQTRGVTTSGEGNNITYTVNAYNVKPTKGTNTYEVEAVYGGGNLAAYEPWNPTATGQYTSYTRTINETETPVAHTATEKPLQVVVDACEKASIRYVYGGGNAAAAPATDVLIIGSYEIGSVFGGGNGKDNVYKNGVWSTNTGADVGIVNNTTYGTGKSLASVVGGTAHYVFGGSNTRGNVKTAAEVFIDKASDCPLNVGEVYGGGNEAYMEGDSKIVLGCIDHLGEIYGGARNANVDGDIDMTITSGHFDRIFGGNNLGGTISGSIMVNIEETGCNPITIGELYGCGNNAPYVTPNGKADPTVNIRSFTSIGRVFGGGYGVNALVTGNPTVNINEFVGENATVTAWPYHQETVEGNLVGKTITFSDGSSVVMPTHESGKIGAIGTVFGGGNAAAVTGNTSVNVGTKEYEYITVPDIAVGDDVSSYYTRSGTGTTDNPYVYTATGASSIAVAGTTYFERKTVLGVDIRGNVFGGGNQAKVTGNTNVVVGR